MTATPTHRKHKRRSLTMDIQQQQQQQQRAHHRRHRNHRGFSQIQPQSCSSTATTSRRFFHRRQRPGVSPNWPQKQEEVELLRICDTKDKYARIITGRIGYKRTGKPTYSGM